MRHCPSDPSDVASRRHRVSHVAHRLQVQRAAAGALRTLAFKNEDNKNLIVECGALPTLIQMLRAEDQGIHYEAVGVIGNLVHSSVNIKKRVLDEGALQPVIRLLSCTCTESQREAALLLGQFATTGEPSNMVNSRSVHVHAAGRMASTSTVPNSWLCAYCLVSAATANVAARPV